MAIKREVHEICPRCGNINAQKRGSIIWTTGHRCINVVPGPQNPPTKFLESEVIWIPALASLQPQPTKEG